MSGDDATPILCSRRTKAILEGGRALPSRRLTNDEAAQADALLAEVKRMVTDAAGGDLVLLFAVRRRLFTRPMYWERGTPAGRTKLIAVERMALAH